MGHWSISNKDSWTLSFHLSGEEVKLQPSTKLMASYKHAPTLNLDINWTKKEVDII